MNIMNIHQSVIDRKVTPIDLVNEALTKIEIKDSEYNAFITVSKAEAMEHAKKLEQELIDGKVRGPLHGIPIAIKDLIDTKGIRTTAGSKIYEDVIPSVDATVIDKLKQAGAIIIGKVNTHEFAYGPTGDRSYFGACRNPYNLDKMSGGSSSGSAVAVSAHFVPASIGTDTGGSIRIPASACGVIGMKPTFGEVSKKGSFPLAYTLDHVGPITTNIIDNALLLNIIVGHDPEDPYSLNRDEQTDYTGLIGEDVKGMTIGIATNEFFTDVDKEIKACVDKTLKIFKDLQLNRKDVSVPGMEEIAAEQAVTIKAEASAVHADHLDSYHGEIDEEVYERLLASKQVKGYEYVQAQTKRAKLIENLNEIFDEVDALLVPTLPILPPNIGQREVSINGATVTTQHALLKLTSPFNYTGNPALSIPCGMSKNGLPIGLQLIGKHQQEEVLYQLGAALETELKKIKK